MRQFRTCTDSVFDLDTIVEGPGEVALVAQAGPPRVEATELPTARAPVATQQDAG
jgi:hypothetical protein